MISGHGGIKSEVEVKASRSVVSTDWGEMFIGTTGKQSSVMNVIRVVTGAEAEGCRDDTLYTFLFDMCRTQTKGATISKIKDKNFAIKMDFERMGLSKRVCQIYAAQAGVAAKADGSLVQRIGHFLRENNLTSIPLRYMTFHLINPRLVTFGFTTFSQGFKTFQYGTNETAGEL